MKKSYTDLLMKKFVYLMFSAWIFMAYSSNEEFQNKNICQYSEALSSEVIDTNDEESMRKFMINYYKSDDGRYKVMDIEKIFIYRVIHIFDSDINREFAISINFEDLKLVVEACCTMPYERVDANDEPIQDFIKKLYSDRYYNICDILFKIKNYYYVLVVNLEGDRCECFVNIDSAKKLFDEVNNHTEDSMWNPYVRREDSSDIDIVDMDSLMMYYDIEDIRRFYTLKELREAKLFYQEPTHDTDSDEILDKLVFHFHIGTRESEDIIHLNIRENIVSNVTKKIEDLFKY